MDTRTRAELIQQLRPAWLADITGVIASGRIGAHELSGTLHTGTLANDQGPQFLLVDGTRQLTGDLSVAAGVKIDGVDISLHAHTGSDGSTQVSHASLTGVSADQHHPQIHAHSTHTSIGPDDHHTALIGLTGDSGTAVPDASDYVQIVGGDGLTSTASGSVVAIALDTPGTVSGTTTNSATGNHTHAVTAYSAGRVSGTARAGELVKYGSAGGLDLGPSTISYADSGGNPLAGDILTVGSLNVHQYAGGGIAIGLNKACDPQFDLDIAGNLRACGWIVGKHAIQVGDPLMICHYDGKIPYSDGRIGETDFTGDLVGHKGQVPTTSGTVVFRKAAGLWGKAVQVAEGTTNIVNNPSFEVDTSSWAAYQGGTLARDTTLSYMGSACASLTSSSTPQPYISQSQPLTPAAGTWYTLSAWVRAGANAVGLTLTARLIERGGAQPDAYSDGSVTLTAQWQRVTVSRQWQQGDRTTVLCNFILNSSASGAVVYIDAVQLEQKAYPTPYHDATINGSNARSAGYLRYPGIPLPRSGTLAIWACSAAPYNAGTYRQLVSCDNGGATGIFVRINSANQLGFAIGGATRITYNLSESLFGALTWHHVAATWDEAANACALYLDGVQVGTSPWYTPTDWGNGWVVGSIIGVQNWPGWLKDFVLWDTVLDAGQIRAIAESRAPVFAESAVYTFRNAPGGMVWADANGLWARSASGNAILGVYGGTSSGYSWGGQSLDVGDVLIGRGNAYTLWDDSAGTLSIGGKITLQSDGTASIAGVLNLGSSGGIFQGTGTFGSPTTGLKIYNSGGIGLLETWRDGTKQVYLDTNGALVAGGGKIALNSAGLRMSPASAGVTDPAASVTWVSGGDRLGCAGAYLLIGGSSTVAGASLVSNPDKAFSYGQTDISAYSTSYECSTSWYSDTGRIELQVYNCSTLTSKYARFYADGRFCPDTVTGTRVYNSTAIPLSTSGTWYNLTFNSERFDTDNIHSTASNTDRLTCSTAGVYLIIGSVRFASNANGDRLLSIVLNGTTTLAMETTRAASGNPTTMTVSAIYQLNVGDYVTLSAQQTSGGSLNIEAAGNYSPEFMMVRLA